MAEGGYDPTDPTTDKTPIIPDTGDDDDDGDDPWADVDWNTPVDPVDPDRTQPFEPGAASTPAGGESIPMTTRTSLLQERGPRTAETSFTTPPDSIPTVSEVDFVDEEEKERKITRLKRFIQDKFPKVDFQKLGPIGFGKRIENRLSFVKFGPKGGEERIIKADNSDLLKSFVASNKKALGPSAENIIVEDREGLAETNQRLKEAEQQEQRFNKTVERQHQALRGVVEMRNQLEQINQRITKIENEGGTVLERQNETDRLKRQAEKLKRDIEEANNKEKEYAQTVKERNKAAKDVARLQRKCDAQRQKLAAEEARLNRTKPLDELETEREDLKRKIKEDMETMYDENASLAQKSEATARFEARTAELERLDPQIQEREEALPLRERVKNIFKKYGWTLQAVALAVGIVLSALALAATNALKAGTKALGNGLKAIGQKLGSLLPGLIGSIVSYIFKAAGSVLSFLGEHAWLLILAVVAFFMERLLKKRKSK